MRKLQITAAALLLSLTLSAEEKPYPQIINVEGRETVSLDGLWNRIVDPYETGYYDYRRNPIERNYFADEHFYDNPERLVEYDFPYSEKIRVPGDWNTQDPRLYYYEGVVWYNRHFRMSPKEGKRYFLYFGAANYETIAGLNGKVLGKHTGGFTPFNFEITAQLKDGDNSVIAMVDNTRGLEKVPTLNFDWWNYGGITRSVQIIETPETFIRDYYLQLKKSDTRTLEGWIQLDGSQASQKVTVSIPELRISKTFQTDENGYAAFEIKAKPLLWCPENPKLYGITISSETDEVSDRIGFRTIETSGTKILLNGKEIFCRGISIHEEKPYEAGGRAYSAEHARELLGWAKELNCNFVRLAHYPHSEAMVRTAEEMGILVWSEIPTYWTIQFDNPDTYANAENQLLENITRDKNRANIIIWSVANETPRGESRLKFLTKLIDKAHEADPVRLVSAAMEKQNLSPTVMTLNDELAEKADLLSFNQYVGWYDGNPDKCDRISWTFDLQKPVFISEWGGGALAGRHGSKTERFTEEYQEYLYEKNIEMYSRVPGLAGSTPWILKDFRSPKRMLGGIQDDYNRKGLVSEYGERKAAFRVLQRWYKELEEKGL